MNRQTETPLNTGRTIAHNLRMTLEVAGNGAANSPPCRLRSSDLQRKTGIARSTLRAISAAGSEKEPNPDTKTLARIAQQLGIPAGLLLFSRRDWQAFISAFDSFQIMLEAAHGLRNSGSGLSNPQAVLEILRTVRVYRDNPEHTGDEDVDAQIKADHAYRNEITRRRAFVLGALLKSAATGAEGDFSYSNVMAFAAALANQSFACDEATTEGAVHGQHI